ELVDARAHCSTDRSPLGADRQAVRRVLDVAADEHRAVFGLERAPDVELRVWGVGAKLYGSRRREERISHSRPLRETRGGPAAPARRETWPRSGRYRRKWTAGPALPGGLEDPQRGAAPPLANDRSRAWSGRCRDRR